MKAYKQENFDSSFDSLLSFQSFFCLRFAPAREGFCLIKSQGFDKQ